MARTAVRPRDRVPPGVSSARSQHRPARRSRPLRFWYLPLLLAVLLPLLLWASANVAFVVFASRDIGVAAAQPVATATAAPDQALLDASVSLVQATPCLPGGGAIAAQPALKSARWSAVRSEADSHAYYVAAADPSTDHLIGIWQVEGGAVLRLQDNTCPGVTAGQPAQLAEAAVLFSPHHLSAAGNGP